VALNFDRVTDKKSSSILRMEWPTEVQRFPEFLE
jgi:hypothetical protein